MQTPYVSQIPIATATLKQQQYIEDLTNKILDAGGKGEQVAVWERELNVLVYELYDLTPEEIALIEAHVGGK